MSATGLVELARDWQTLISATLALVAAWWTVRTIKQQITADRERHKDALKRKEFAARAQLPDALSILCRFTENCMRHHDGRIQQQPAPATEAIAELKAAIEFVDAQPAQKIFELVSFYQVHNARLFSDWRRRERPENAERLYDTALLRHYVDRLYKYARNEAQTVNDQPTEENLISALRVAVGLEHYMSNDERYEGVRDIIHRRHGSPRT